MGGNGYSSASQTACGLRNKQSYKCSCRSSRVETSLKTSQTHTHTHIHTYIHTYIPYWRHQYSVVLIWYSPVIILSVRSGTRYVRYTMVPVLVLVYRQLRSLYARSMGTFIVGWKAVCLLYQGVTFVLGSWQPDKCRHFQ